MCCLFFVTGTVCAAPLYPLGGAPPLPLRPGTTEQIQRDHSPLRVFADSKPDRSFQSVWVRLFPLVSLPLGDPYPDTQNFNAAIISNTGGFKVFSLLSEALLATGKVLEFEFNANRVFVDKKAHNLEALWILPAGTATSEVVWDKNGKLPNGKPAEVRVRVRGGFVVKRSVHVPKDTGLPSDLWSIINVVNLNDYLRSVVPSEVISSWHRETLRAQAIAARTYGLFETAVARAQGLDFDVDPSTWYQSYQGVQFYQRDTGKFRDVELPATSEAVRSTKSEVILYKNEVIKAYFSSNSGGRTCTVSECLELNYDPPYIAEVNDHPQIRSQPGGTWGSRATLTPDTILGVLLAQGVDPGAPVSRLEHLERGPSGRTWRLRVMLTNGKSVDLTRLVTRKIMHLYGPIRSFLYDLGAIGSDGKQAIRGYGYGHAVGMSQWGAQLFARGGMSAHAILQHYYRDVTIKDMSASP